MKCSLSFPAVKKKHAHGALLQSYDNRADTTLFVVVIITALEITAGLRSLNARMLFLLFTLTAGFIVWAVVETTSGLSSLIRCNFCAGFIVCAVV